MASLLPSLTESQAEAPNISVQHMDSPAGQTVARLRLPTRLTTGCIHRLLGFHPHTHRCPSDLVLKRKNQNGLKP